MIHNNKLTIVALIETRVKLVRCRIKWGINGVGLLIILALLGAA